MDVSIQHVVKDKLGALRAAVIETLHTEYTLIKKGEHAYISSVLCVDVCMIIKDRRT